MTHRLLILFLGLQLSAISQNNLSNSLSNQDQNNLVADTSFVRLKDYSDAFEYNLKYATTDNFLKSKVYDCAECYLRLKTVKALIKANKKFIKKGFRIQLFDCYRPLDIQKKMWAIVPNPEFVANPSKGSIHNRGGAVDLTLVTLDGKVVDMGTAFDYFGKEASHGYFFDDKNIRNNRKLLRKVMIQNGFNALESEWWHYNLKDAKNDQLSNKKWDCN